MNLADLDSPRPSPRPRAGVRAANTDADRVLARLQREAAEEANAVTEYDAVASERFRGLETVSTASVLASSVGADFEDPVEAILEEIRIRTRILRCALNTPDVDVSDVQVELLMLERRSAAAWECLRRCGGVHGAKESAAHRLADYVRRQGDEQQRENDDQVGLAGAAGE